MTSICLYTSEFGRNTVCRILSLSIKLDTYDVWRKFCKFLDNEDFQSANKHLPDDDKFYRNIQELLKEWGNRRKTEATLGSLLEVLDRCELWEESDDIRETFSLPPAVIKLPDVCISSPKVLKEFGAHVSRNCSTLSNSTNINHNMLKYLKETCSSKSPLLCLTAINVESSDDLTKGHEFYSALRNNPKCLEDFIVALEKDGQYKPAWVLRGAYRQFDIIETVFKRIASNPYDVDEIITSALASDSKFKFSQLFYRLFPEFGDFSPAMKSFLGILSSFQFPEGGAKDKALVQQIFQALDITYSESDGIFQFWVYLIKIYTILRNKDFPKGFPMIFNFMNAFPIQQTRVVILGQFPSPYCKPSGFAYHGCKSRSIRTILKTLNTELRLVDTFSKEQNKLEIPRKILKNYKKNGSLDGWVQQGVLMFNVLLTHRDPIWSNFVDFLITHLNANYSNIVFIITGKLADEKRHLIDQNKHAVLSMFLPPNETHTVDNLIFIKTNFYLYQVSKNMIDWNNVSSMEEGDNCYADGKQERVFKYKRLFDELLKVSVSTPSRNETHFIRCFDSIEDSKIVSGLQLCALVYIMRLYPKKIGTNKRRKMINF